MPCTLQVEGRHPALHVNSLQPLSRYGAKVALTLSLTLTLTLTLTLALALTLALSLTLALTLTRWARCRRG